jgi:transposase
MVRSHKKPSSLTGPRGSLPLLPGDEIGRKLFMLIEGESLGLGATKAAEKYGYSKQRYYQLLADYRKGGAPALRNEKRGPKTNYRRTPEVEQLVIRYRFLDEEASPEVIAQKIRQAGHPVSTRSVQRVLQNYGLQKKTPPAAP